MFRLGHYVRLVFLAGALVCAMVAWQDYGWIEVAYWSLLFSYSILITMYAFQVEYLISDPEDDNYNPGENKFERWADAVFMVVAFIMLVYKMITKIV